MKYLIPLFVFWCFQTHAQDGLTKTHVIDSLELNADMFWGKDKFGYYYYSKGSNFTKSQEHEHWEFKNPNLGKLSRVDLTNPLRILLFYDVYNKVIVLDNQLNETSSINFSTYSEPVLIAALGTAAQNRIWLFNANNQQIGLYDLKSNRIQYLTVPGKENIKAYDSELNYFYWVNNSNELYRCNIFGRIEQLGNLNNPKRFKVVSERRILYENKSGLYFFNHENKEHTKIMLNAYSIQNFSYVEQILTIFTLHQIINFKIESP
jgi:hypothetical protein